jgi:uncharacterized protein
MPNRKIGRVSATEKNPSSCDEFMFWLEEKMIIGPFDIIRVENTIAGKETVTYGIVQDIFHITDSPGHLSNYVSSDFGNIDVLEQTNKLALSYAKASVLYNDQEIYMPVHDGSIVYDADEEDIKKALGLENIDSKDAICAGILKTSAGVSVPVAYNSAFLIGPEGAHINISGISGLATKTSYAMFLLQAIAQRNSDVAMIVLNVKGEDLLMLDMDNTKITEAQQKEWGKAGLECKPFENVKYLYPYKKGRDEYFSNTSLPQKLVESQLEVGIAKNYIYTYENDREKLDLLFSNVDDPNFTIESILNYIAENQDFESLTWDTFKTKLKEYTRVETHRTGANKEIPIQSWRKFSRIISNSIGNDIFQSSESRDKKRAHCFLSKEVARLRAGETMVVDIAKLDEQLQCLVFGDIIKAVYDIKHGDSEYDSADTFPKKVIIFVDELNKYAPSTSPKSSPILNYLLEITERGRSEGVILFSAEQFKSAVHDRIKGNCSTHVYGRTNAIEISKPDYRYIPTVFSNMMTRLGKGDLIIQHPVFKTPLKVQFPYPSYRQSSGE